MKTMHAVLYAAGGAVAGAILWPMVKPHLVGTASPAASSPAATSPTLPQPATQAAPGTTTSTTSTTTTTTSSPPVPSATDVIIALQAGLRQLGYAISDAPGVFGPSTKSSLAAYYSMTWPGTPPPASVAAALAAVQQTVAARLAGTPHIIRVPFPPPHGA